MGPKMWHNRLSELSVQLALCYDFWDEVQVVCAQNHGRLKINNGVLAIANCMMIINGRDPVQFNLQKNLKKQLVNMLTNDRLGLFQAKIAVANMTEGENEKEIGKRNSERAKKEKEKEKRKRKYEEKEKEKYEGKRAKMTEGEKENEKENQK